MTTLFDSQVAGKPAVHVLAIGVGAYRHLIQEDDVAQLADRPLGLGQLTSPPLSAKAVADWFLGPAIDPDAAGFRNQTHALGTVEALISGSAPASIQTPQGAMAVDPATRQNIQDAFDLWLQRMQSCDTHIGVLYFCGHGIATSDHYLLAEDFGANRNAPWANAFNISKTVLAVEREVKGNLFFFIDACRKVSKEVALTLGADPYALCVLDLQKPVIRNSTTVVMATGETQLAFGLSGKISRFTQALLKALSGYCGIRIAGSPTWDIDGEALAPAVRKLLEKENKTASRRQVSDQALSGTPVPLVRLTAPPQVMVELDLAPEAMRQHSLLYLRSQRGRLHQQQGVNGPFSVEVPRGIYEVGASPVGGQFNATSLDDQELIPPCYEFTLSV